MRWRAEDFHCCFTTTGSYCVIMQENAFHPSNVQEDPRVLQKKKKKHVHSLILIFHLILRLMSQNPAGNDSTLDSNADVPGCSVNIQICLRLVSELYCVTEERYGFFSGSVCVSGICCEPEPEPESEPESDCPASLWLTPNPMNCPPPNDLLFTGSNLALFVSSHQGYTHTHTHGQWINADGLIILRQAVIINWKKKGASFSQSLLCVCVCLSVCLHVCVWWRRSGEWL